MNNNFQNKNDINEGKNKAKTIWKTIGYIGLALFLAALTIVVLNLNR